MTDTNIAAPTFAPRKVVFTIFGVPCHWPRPPRRFFAEVSGGQALFPLIVLVGLVGANQLDQTAFGILGPNIRDDFHLSNQGYLTLVALSQLGGLLLSVPLAYYSDRLPRIALALIGAAIWAVFGFFTAFAFSVLSLVVVRSVAGAGRAVITPTHNSLLSDYYPPQVRPDVFGFHAMGSRSARSLGPLIGGALGQWFNWRVPFVVFVIPSIVFVIMGLKHEGARSRPLGAPGRRRVARRHPHRRSPTLVRGIDPHPLAGRHAAAHLVLTAVPRGRVHRPRHPDVPLLPAGVRPR